MTPENQIRPAGQHVDDPAMRVLHMFPFLGIGAGGAYAALTLIEEQQKRRPTWVFSLLDDEFSREARKLGAHVTSAFPDIWPESRFTRWMGTVRAMRRAVREHKINLIHCHSTPGNRYCFPVSRMTGVPLITHQRDTYQPDHFHAWVSKTDRIIATSEWVRTHLPESLRPRVTVVHDAVPVPSERAIVWPPREGPLVIGLAGRCVPDKGHDLLIEAVKTLSKRYLFLVEIWGMREIPPFFDYGPKLRRMVHEAGLDERFRFEGFRRDMENFYRRVDIAVVPSRVAEGFGLTAAEGQAWGKVVIAAAHGGLTEIVEHDKTGLLFRPHDAASLTVQLERALADPDLRDRVARAGRESAAHRFTPAIHTDGVEAIYRSVLHGADPENDPQRAPATQPESAGKRDNYFDEPSPQPQVTVGERARSGFIWLMGQTVGLKLINGVMTFIAALWLLPSDYKLAALALPIIAFATVFQQLGVDRVLIARGDEFKKWANAGFWLSATAGVGISLFILILAPIAARIYGQPALTDLFIGLVVLGLMNGLTTVHQAWLQHSLKFRLIVILGLTSAMLQATLLVWMARTGWGARSLVYPGVAAVALRMIVLWWKVRIDIKLNPEFAKWRYMIGDSTLVFATQWCFLITAQGDYMLLGVLFPNSDLLGYFNFAFNLSVSIIVPLVMNSTAVLVPALTALRDDPIKQTDVFLRASRKLVIAGFPLCILQGLLVSPFLHAIYGSKWDGAIAVVEVLSLCMALRMGIACFSAMFQARSRFKTHFWVMLAYAAGFMVAVWIGAQFKTGVAVAFAETIVLVGFEVIGMYIAIAPGGKRLSDILGLYRGVVPASIIGAVAALAATVYGPFATLWLAQFIIRATLFVAVYVAALYMTDHRGFRESVDLSIGMAMKLFKRRGRQQVETPASSAKAAVSVLPATGAINVQSVSDTLAERVARSTG